MLKQFKSLTMKSNKIISYTPRAVDKKHQATMSASYILDQPIEIKLLYLSLHQMYEVDRDNCLMSTSDWILELAKAMTDPDYKEKFKKEYREYRKEVEA
jgi:hypothetical protein